MLLILALLIGVPLLVVALFLVLVFLTPRCKPEYLPPDVDPDQLNSLLTNTRRERQADLERAMADPQSRQRYNDYMAERERVDPKP